ncbi:hypothetical protein BDFG_08998 [Blastomyces dermatitidis ATCC 26199]|nr:hypothetical protein BDFG_08998 [Blastomyces dermatitidis ATCC 26199]
MIIKKLFMSCVTESSVSFSASSATSFPAALSQSSTLTPVSGSPAPATSVPATPTLTTSGFSVSAFITSSLCFKKMLCRLNELHLSMCTLPPFLLTLRMIYYMKTVYDITI